MLNAIVLVRDVILAVYSQHLLYMSENESEIPECMTCPRQLFGHALKNFLETRREQRDQLIICGDLNSNYSELSNWMLEMALTDLISDRHGPGPKICTRSKK